MTGSRRSGGIRKSGIALLCTSFFCIFFYCHGEDVVVINSDSTQYTKESIRCNGNVIILYQKHIISADSIVYDRERGIVNANGNVILRDEKQNIYFFEAISIGRNFSSGSGKNIKILLYDKSRLAATCCVIKDGKYELENVIYTPCYECVYADELTWQIKALRVVFDPNDSTEYREAKFELIGSPILYTPYFLHASPKLKRKSGFLAPKFSTSSKSGLSLSPQYLWSISDSQELILKPIVTSRIGNVGWAYYGLRFPDGEFNMDASITGVQSADVPTDIENKDTIRKVKNSGYRGHIFSKMKYEINDIWRCGFNVNLASDKYYLKRYPLLEKGERILTSDAGLEGFDGRNYTSLKTAMFQSDYPECAPRILPVIERNYSKNLFAGTFSIDTLFTNLDFQDHRSSRKFVSDVAWQKEMLFPGGHLINFTGSLSLQAQNVSEREESHYDSFFRVNPQANTAWKWPLVVSFGTEGRTVFTPIFGAIVAGNKKNIDIFEEPFCEITEVNFSERSRSISPYNIDSGKRIYYGLRLASYKRDQNKYRIIIGRSVELTDPMNRFSATGLKYRHSNIVGSADAFLSNKWSLVTNGSYSPRSNKWARIEMGVNFFDKKFGMDLMVFRGKQCLYNPFSIILDTYPEEQKTQKYRGVMLDAWRQVTRKVKLKGVVIIGNDVESMRKIPKKGNDKYRLIRQSVGLEYQNECTFVNFLVERRNYRGGDLKPETVFRFVAHLKNLGL
ncbi:MAG: LPS assembly protein LptD [Holosporaceae bacterium]|jgi:LPS-assembly protein|nr:LPS assembly protein LptD [Holosporaceae bacterium]